MILLLVFLKGFVISLAWNSPSKQNKKVLSHVSSFWSDIYKKCQEWFWMFEAYLEWNFCKSRIGSRVKISHWIQPSNLSSALDITLLYFLVNPIQLVHCAIIMMNNFSTLVIVCKWRIIYANFRYTYMKMIQKHCILWHFHGMACLKDATQYVMYCITKHYHTIEWQWFQIAKIRPI